MNPPPNPRAAEAAAEMRAYNAPLLANPPQSPRPVPLWNMDAARRWHIEANDTGCELWIDDPNSIDAAAPAAPQGE